MTDVIANLFINVHLCKAKLTLFLDGSYFQIAPTVSEYSLLQMFPKVLVDGSSSSPRNVLTDHHSLRFDILFHGL